MTADPQRAFSKLEAMSVDRCISVLGNARDVLGAEQIQSLSRWALTLSDVEKRRQVLIRTTGRVVFAVPSDPKREVWEKALLALPANADDKAWMGARLLAGSAPSSQNEITKAEVEWVERNIAPSHQTYVKGAIARLFPPTQALIELGKQLDKTPNDDLIAGYVESEDIRPHDSDSSSFRKASDTAFKLATRTNDSVRRIELLVRAWTDLHKASLKAAQSILDSPELKQTDRVLLEGRIAPLMEKKP